MSIKSPRNTHYIHLSTISSIMCLETALQNSLKQEAMATTAQEGVDTPTEGMRTTPTPSDDYQYQYITQARRLLTESPLIGNQLNPVQTPSPSLTPSLDGHNDFPYVIRGWFANKFKSPTFSISTLPIGQTDLSRLSRGHVGAQFWSAFVPWYASTLSPSNPQKT